MKKLLLAVAAVVFSGGLLKAQPIQNGPRDPSRMQVWKSTNVVGTTAKVSNSAFIHQVLVSSPAAVDYSTNAVLNIYGSQDATGNLLARIQLSTNELTSNEISRTTLDIYASTGLSVSLLNGVDSGDEAGSVQILYTNGPPSDFRVWQSSFMPSDVSTHTLALGPVILHKVIVLKAATGTSPLRIYNSTHTGVSPAVQVAQIDLTEGDREYDMDIMLSRGLTTNIQQNGTVSANVMFLFKRNPPSDWEYWMPNFASATVTTRSIAAGRAVFGGVLNGDGVGDSMLTVYDSNGTANNKIADIIGDTVFDFDESNYEVGVSSGLTITTKGNGQYTVRYRRLR